MNASTANIPGKTPVSGRDRVRWVAWSLAAACIAGAILMLLAYNSATSEYSYMTPDLLCIAVPVVGLTVAVAQWIGVHAAVPKPLNWLLMSGLGWSLGCGLGMVAGYLVGFVVDPKVVAVGVAGGFYPGPAGVIVGSLVLGAALGFMLGLMQLAAVADSGLKARWRWLLWPAENALGWGLGFLAAFALAVASKNETGKVDPLLMAASVLVFAAVSALITSLGIGLILNTPSKEIRNP